MVKKTGHRSRLDEIAATQIEGLSDEEVLRLLAERKQLQVLQEEYEKSQQEQTKLAELEKEEGTVSEKITELNKRISPDRPDDELLELIKERKTLEGEIERLDQEEAMLKHEPSAPPHQETETFPQVGTSSQETDEPSQGDVTEEQVPREEAPQEETAGVSLQEETRLNLSPSNPFGEEAIVTSGIREGSELGHLLDQLRDNMSSMGTILEGAPQAAKKSKEFMLQVALLDPAYAMHYADKDTLKKDEDFNLKVATMKNDRNSGNPFSEMLPEGRTAKVVFAGVKQDYRNIRFALPNMNQYEEMIALAKKGALEKIKSFKEGVDPTLLIPKVLQKDKAFMDEVEKIAPKGE